MTRTLGALALAMGLSSVAAAEDRPESGEERTESQRPLEPIASDLEAFSLRPPATVSIDTGATPLFHLAGWGMVAASAADLATTEWGLSRGLREANPLASDRGVRLLHHVAAPAAVWWTTERLRRSGRTKLAVSLRIALMAAYGYAAFHNAHRIGAGSP